MHIQAKCSLLIGALLVMASGMAACESVNENAVQKTTRTDVPLQEVNGPKWLTQKGAAFSGERRVFYGVGNAAAIINPALRRRAAEAAARRDIAQTFSVYIAALQKQYMAETTAGAMDKNSVEQHVEDVMKQITEATLVGTNIVEYWENPTRNEAYALARLDLQEFLESTKGIETAKGQVKELDAKVRDFVRENATKAHDQLSQELQKGK